LADIKILLTEGTSEAILSSIDVDVQTLLNGFTAIIEDESVPIVVRNTVESNRDELALGYNLAVGYEEAAGGDDAALKAAAADVVAEFENEANQELLENASMFVDGTMEMLGQVDDRWDIESVKSRVDRGVDLVQAARDFKSDSEDKTGEWLIGRAIFYAVMVIAGLIGLIGGIVGAAKNKGFALGLITSIISIGATIYALVGVDHKSLPDDGPIFIFPLIMVIVLAVFAVLSTITSIGGKKDA